MNGRRRLIKTHKNRKWSRNYWSKPVRRVIGEHKFMNSTFVRSPEALNIHDELIYFKNNRKMMHYIEFILSN